MTTYSAIRVGLVNGARYCALAALVQVCGAQAIPPKTTTSPVNPSATGPAAAVTSTGAVGSMSREKAPTLATDPPGTIDRVIAIVNGDLILESDVDEERRFAAFQPFSAPSRTFSRDQAIQRLINRTLILQQAKLQVTDEVKAVDVTKQIDTLRKEIPECKVDQCETEEGWNKFLARQGFTAAELQQRWKERMQVLAYIENRFRMGIRIKPEEIKQYYDTVMLPEYKRHNSTPPKLDDISARIQEILLQQRVSQLLQDWLKSLRAQGTVQIMKPGEVAP